jgi:glycosyltransferase involved in cell wall biosynthesis
VKPRPLVFSTFDSPDNPFYGGGGARAVHEIARRLAARGHQVTVLTGRFPGSKDACRDQVAYRHVGLGGRSPKLSQLVYQACLPFHAARRRYDLWIESLTPPFSAACLQKFTRRPVVALTQVLAGEAMSRRYHLPFDSLERAGLRTYRFAIATSGYLRNRLMQIQPRLHIAVIPNGTDPELVRRDPGPPADRHLLFLGRLAIHQKGLDLLLNAYQPARRDLPPLVIAGSGVATDEAWLLHRIQELGLAPRVRLVGRVDGEAKSTWLREAMALVMPSRYEASPLVAVEGFCYRLPVVLYAIPELEDLPDTCCVKVPAFDVPALTAALRALAADPARRRTLGDQARAFSRDFDWDTLADRYEAFCETILARTAD